jgi:predicted nucleotidyltransferase
MALNKMTIDTVLKRMVRRIVRKFNPEQVILFGSYARGDADTDSDVDLLVVMNIKGSKRRQQLQVRTALRERTVPVDVIITRPEDFVWRKDVFGTMEWPATHEGRVLYARK